MSWQDAVIAIGQAVMVVSLIPTIRSNGGAAIPLSTSVPTVVVLLAFTTTFATLDLVMATTTSMGAAVAWGVIMRQRIWWERR